jgi:NADH-quinone oxidoreductase subunit C
VSAGTERLEAKKLEASLPGALLKVKEFRSETFLCVKREAIKDVIRLLKEDADLAYDYFCECVGVDYSAWEHERDLEGRFEVVYNLMSSQTYNRIFVKVAVDDGQKVPTVKDIFLGAEYPEREVNDLFGVVFEGNEQSDRFLLPDDWVGYPLRKEYPLGGDDVLFAQGDRGPAVEDVSMPHAGESFEGKTGSEDVSGR